MHPQLPSVEHLARLQERSAALRKTLIQVLRGHDCVTLEIGSGHGHYLTAYAQAHPARFCVGIDIMSERLERSERKRKRARLPNLAFLHASADCLLSALPDDVTLDDIIILFPDPWPKRRHHKHRLIQPEFLASVAAKAIPGARLCFRTDSADYFVAAEAIIAAQPAWTIKPDAPWPFEMPTVFQSRAPTYRSIIALRR